MLFDMWKYIYSESLFNTLYAEVKHKFKKKSSYRINVTKVAEVKHKLKKKSFAQNKRYKKCTFFSFVSSNSSQFYF